MRKIYISAAALAFFYALLTQLPASLAWSWWAQSAAANGVYLEGATGTVFEGKASRLRVQSLSLDQPSWQTSFWPLLIGMVNVQLNGSIDKYPLQTHASLRLTGNMVFSETELTIGVARLAPMLKLPFVPIDGMVSLNMDRVTTDGEQIISAEGLVKLVNTQWRLVKPPEPLGTLQADISTVDEVITANLSSEGPLRVSGEATLQPDGQYNTDIRLQSKQGSNSRIDKLLRTTGQPVDGWYRVKYQGQAPGR